MGKDRLMPKQINLCGSRCQFGTSIPNRNLRGFQQLFHNILRVVEAGEAATRHRILTEGSVPATPVLRDAWPARFLRPRSRTDALLRS